MEDVRCGRCRALDLDRSGYGRIGSTEQEVPTLRHDQSSKGQRALPRTPRRASSFRRRGFVALPAKGSERELRGIALCAGAGGLELGLHLAQPGYRTVCYVERQAFAAAILVARMADQALCDAPLWDDVATFDGRPWRGRVDLLSAGYPCQPFSSAGHRQGDQDPRHLWPHLARIAAEIEPEWLFIENVAGHLDLGFDAVLGDLSGMGYRIKAGLFTAFEVGASHQRARLFALAHANRFAKEDAGGPQDRPQRLPVHPRGQLEAVRVAGGGTMLDGVLAADARARFQRRSTAAELPLFPPAPCDYPAWRKVLAARPDLQPCLFGLDDGLARGVERAVVAGNGVVPLAAAYAWCTLRAAFEGD